jgi:ubiquinone biosynthesis protein UbiJ
MVAPASSESAGASRGGDGLFTPPLAAAINHLLRGASWARERLRPFAGKAVRFDVAPFAFTLEILDNGEVASSQLEPATRFTLTPALAMRMAAADADAWRDVVTSGDTALAREILYLAQNLRWDFEEDLSRVFGDIVAHRMAGAARAFAGWQRTAADSFARQASAYLTEERPLVAARPLLEQFSLDVDALRDDVARFEKRLEQLAARQLQT